MHKKRGLATLLLRCLYPLFVNGTLLSKTLCLSLFFQAPGRAAASYAPRNDIFILCLYLKTED